jgi:hypothetical protein
MPLITLTHTATLMDQRNREWVTQWLSKFGR